MDTMLNRLVLEGWQQKQIASIMDMDPSLLSNILKALGYERILLTKAEAAQIRRQRAEAALLPKTV